jgi:hypothetical protein
VAIQFTTVADFANQRLTSVGSPSVGTDAANKNYVDNAIQGLDWKASVRAGSTGNINLASPGATIDGVSMNTNDRFLAKDQTSGAQNGIYVYNGASSAATRATDANSNAAVTTGMATSVEEGTVNGGKVYLLITPQPITIGTTALTFTVMNGGSTAYTAGNGLTLTGTVFSVTPGTGIVVSGSGTAIDTSVVPRKYSVNVGDGTSTSITVNHALGTKDVHVEVYSTTTPFATIWCEVDRPDTNNVTLVFATAPASGAYRAVVVG